MTLRSTLSGKWISINSLSLICLHLVLLGFPGESDFCQTRRWKQSCFPIGTSRCLTFGPQTTSPRIAIHLSSGQGPVLPSSRCRRFPYRNSYLWTQLSLLPWISHLTNFPYICVVPLIDTLRSHFEVHWKTNLCKYRRFSISFGQIPFFDLPSTLLGITSQWQSDIAQFPVTCRFLAVLNIRLH